MDRVRFGATVFFWAGWFSLAVAVVGIFATLISLPPQQTSYSMLPAGSFIAPSAIMTLVSLPYHLVLPVSLFFAWGVLTGLSEIHDLLLDEEVA